MRSQAILAKNEGACKCEVNARSRCKIKLHRKNTLRKEMPRGAKSARRVHAVFTRCVHFWFLQHLQFCRVQAAGRKHSKTLI